MFCVGWFGRWVMPKKEPRIQRESLPLANRIFLASGLKFAYRKFFHALTGKMLASGFVKTISSKIKCGLIWSVGYANAHSRLKRREHTDFPQITRRYASRTVGEIRRPLRIERITSTDYLLTDFSRTPFIRIRQINIQQ